MGSYRVCCCFTRKFKVTEADPPSDVKEAFRKYSDDGIHMTVDQLRRFIDEFQGGNGGAVSISDAERIVEQVLHKRHPITSLINRKTLTLEDFHHYLFNSELNPPIGSQVHQDMTAPLSHYFIYTGHNSYLTGNQLSSPCSDVPIIKALKRGVRVIELDLWPNSSKDNVHVLHGRTLTTPVELIRCLKSIKEHAFTASPFPVIITLEDHLTPDLQEKVAQDESDESDHDTEDLEDHVKKSASCPAYKSLIAIHAGKPKGGLEEALKVEKDKVRRLSLAEQALEKAAERHQQHIVRFTQKNILRIYPKGTRFTSSNYKPLIGWLHGAQMVAFNMQGYGRSLWLMHGMFRANGGCGYVRKPDFLMTNSPLFDPKAKLPVKKTLKVKVYMGDGWHLDFKQTHFDAYSPPDFYTRVGISGAAADEVMKRTKAKEDNWTPVWNEEFIFELTLPEIALLRIEVHEYDMSEKDDFAGQTCLPVSELRPGIRAVPLCNRKGDPYTAARLLMRFEFLS